LNSTLATGLALQRFVLLTRRPYGAGYGHLTSADGVSDHTLARYLNQVVEPGKGDPPGPRKFTTLFR
jgi:hypothetical protein